MECSYLVYPVCISPCLYFTLSLFQTIVVVDLVIIILWSDQNTEREDVESYTYDIRRNSSVSDVIHTSIKPNHYMLPQPDCNQKLLVYSCTSRTRVCSGLGDRERGIISSFLLALLTNRTFVVKHSFPCSLSNFFEPNRYDWSKCIAHTGSIEETYYVEYIDGKCNLPDLATLEKGDIWNARVVEINTNAILNSRIKLHASVNDTIPWVFLGNRDFSSNLLFNTLFKLTKSLEDKVNEFLRIITHGGTKTLIGVHIRREFIEAKDLIQIFRTLRAFSDESKYTIFIASEDREIRERALKQFPNCVSLNVSGLELHINQKTANCETFHYAIFEQQILSRSDILFKTKSEFSRLAYMIKGYGAKVYEFRRIRNKLKVVLLDLEFQNPEYPVF